MDRSNLAGDPTAGKASSKPKSFRILDIPDRWSKEDLRRALQTVDPSLTDPYTLSLYPACQGTGQVAIITLPQPTEYFKQVAPYQRIFAYVDEADLWIDCDFDGLTPLNHPPDEIVAE
jgi:hypothetical protein